MAATAGSVASALAEVAARVAAAAAKRPPPAAPVRLVAVSKTKPVAAVQAAYDTGHRDFGENYVQVRGREREGSVFSLFLSPSYDALCNHPD